MLWIIRRRKLSRCLMRFTKRNTRLSKKRVKLIFKFIYFKLLPMSILHRAFQKLTFRNVGSEWKNYLILQSRWDWHVTSVTTYWMSIAFVGHLSIFLCSYLILFTDAGKWFKTQTNKSFILKKVDTFDQCIRYH